MALTLRFQGGTESLWTGRVSAGWPGSLPGLSGPWPPTPCLGVLGDSCPTGSSREGAFGSKARRGWASCFPSRAARVAFAGATPQRHTLYKLTLCSNTTATAHPGDPLFSLS